MVKLVTRSFVKNVTFAYTLYAKLAHSNGSYHENVLDTSRDEHLRGGARSS